MTNQLDSAPVGRSRPEKRDFGERTPVTGFNVELSPRYRLAALARLWTSSTEKLYERRFGIGLSEWRILAIVGAEAPINAGAIADRGLLEKSHISRLVARLTRRGLITSAPDEADARRAWLTITPKGRALFDRVAEVSRERDEQFLEPLTPNDRATLIGLLDKLTAHSVVALAAEDGFDG